MAPKMPSEKITTGVGTALYPHIHAKDTRFDDPEDAKYKCGIVLKGSAAKKFLSAAKKLIKGAIDSGVTSAQMKLPGEWDKATETLELKNTGSRFQPAVFDAAGNPMPSDTNIGGGSKIRLALNLRVYEGFGHTGVACYLQAVQVIDLVEGAGGDAEDFGFDATEGFEYEGDGGDVFGEPDTQSDDDEDFDGADF